MENLILIAWLNPRIAKKKKRLGGGGGGVWMGEEERDLKAEKMSNTKQR